MEMFNKIVKAFGNNKKSFFISNGSELAFMPANLRNLVVYYTPEIKWAEGKYFTKDYLAKTGNEFAGNYKLTKDQKGNFNPKSFVEFGNLPPYEFVKYASEDETRPQLTGVYVNNGHASATNGHILYTNDNFHMPVEMGTLVSVHIMKVVAALVGRKNVPNYKFHFSEKLGAVMVKIGDLTIVHVNECINQKYPHLPSVIPYYAENELVIEVSESINNIYKKYSNLHKEYFGFKYKHLMVSLGEKAETYAYNNGNNFEAKEITEIKVLKNDFKNVTFDLRNLGIPLTRKGTYTFKAKDRYGAFMTEKKVGNDTHIKLIMPLRRPDID